MSRISSDSVRAHNYHQAKLDIERMIQDEVYPAKYSAAIEVALDALNAMCSLEYCVKLICETFAEETE